MNKDGNIETLLEILKIRHLENPDCYQTQKPYITTKQAYQTLSTQLQKIPYYQKLLYVGRTCFLEVCIHCLENADTQTQTMRNPFLQTLLLDLITLGKSGQKISLQLLRWFRDHSWVFPFQPAEMYNLQEDYPVDYTNHDPPIESPSYGEIRPIPEVVEQPKYVRQYSAEEIDDWRKKIDQFRYGDRYIW